MLETGQETGHNPFPFHVFAPTVFVGPNWAEERINSHFQLN